MVQYVKTDMANYNNFGIPNFVKESNCFVGYQYQSTTSKIAGSRV